MGWVDSHCHLSFASEGAEAVLARARAAGVARMVCVGTGLESSQAAVALAEANADVVATVGLHPHDASRLEDEWDALAGLAGHPEVVGVGECGFDLHYEHSALDEQDRAFRVHVRLAHELDRALVIHSREAWDATFRALEEEGVPERTVFHCFTGGPGEADRALALGTYLSFSGIITFKNADDVRAACALAPPERVLVETDAPYLAPVPHRGRENEPALVVAVGEGVAAATGRPVEEVARSTTAVAAAVFRLPG